MNTQEANELFLSACESGDTVTLTEMVPGMQVDVNTTEKVDGNTGLILAVRENKEEVVRFLVENTDIDVNSANKYGYTALMQAAQIGNLNILNLLLSRPDTDLELVNRAGRRAEDCARKKHRDSVRNLILEAKNTRSRLVGLTNLGNTCYMNCVLQALHHTLIFRDQVVSHTCDMQRQRVLASLQQVFLFLRYSKRNIFSPSEFLRLARPPWFQAGRQQDCSEFLTHLLDTLQEEEQSCASHSEPSLVRKVFGLKLKTSIQCRNCRWQSENEDWVTDLHLSIRDPESKVLSNLIENYFEPEHLTGDNEYSCRNCDTPTEADRTVTVVSAPECLLITMLRFEYNSEYNRRAKIMTDVFSPLYLELPVAVGEQRYHYHLYGVVIHSGNTCDGGHYYTWIR